MDSEINAVCSLIINNKRIKKIDIYTVYRAITAKKNRVSIDESWFDLEQTVHHDDVIDFIKNVNPFFDMSDQVKLDRYRTYYMICKKLLDNCIKLIKEQDTPAYYRIKDLLSNTFLTFNNLNDSSHSDGRFIAQYEKIDDALEITAKYLRLFNFLELEKRIEIVTFNSQHKVIGAQEFKQ
jgi:hypothetical protein